MEAEGLHASSVLINGDRQVYRDFPTPWSLDHVIVVLPVGSQEVWMDPSSAVLPFRMLAYPLRGKDALRISSGVVPHLEKTPREAPISNTWSEQIEGTVAENGTLDALVTITARGDSELPLPQFFLLRGASMRPRGVQGAVIKGSSVAVGSFILTSVTLSPLWIPEVATKIKPAALTAIVLHNNYASYMAHYQIEVRWILRTVAGTAFMRDRHWEN